MTFDPFMSLSVPLPHKVRTLSVIFMSKDPANEPREVHVTCVIHPFNETLLVLDRHRVAT